MVAIEKRLRTGSGVNDEDYIKAKMMSTFKLQEDKKFNVPMPVYGYMHDEMKRCMQWTEEDNNDAGSTLNNTRGGTKSAKNERKSNAIAEAVAAKIGVVGVGGGVASTETLLAPMNALMDNMKSNNEANQTYKLEQLKLQNQQFILTHGTPNSKKNLILSINEKAMEQNALDTKRLECDLRVLEANTDAKVAAAAARTAAAELEKKEAEDKQFGAGTAPFDIPSFMAVDDAKTDCLLTEGVLQKIDDAAGTDGTDDGGSGANTQSK